MDNIISFRKEQLPEHVLQAVENFITFDDDFWSDNKVFIVYRESGDAYRSDAVDLARKLVKEKGVRYDLCEVRTKNDDKVFVVFEDDFD